MMIANVTHDQIDGGQRMLGQVETLERRPVEQQVPRTGHVTEVVGVTDQVQAITCGWRGPTGFYDALPDEGRPAQRIRRSWWDALGCMVVNVTAPRWTCR